MAPDSGSAEDAGSADDAGGAEDAGGVDDAGGTEDAGLPADTGSADDAGLPADAGRALDAGMPADGGTDMGPLAAPDEEDGCTCAAPKRGRFAGLGGLLLFGLLSLRRRPRRWYRAGPSCPRGPRAPGS
ncbi:MAG: hypothetical protein AAFU79_30010, partial [Myxococcota bacterium]